MQRVLRQARRTEWCRRSSPGLQHPTIEALETRTLLAGISQTGGIGYLPSDSGTIFQRYDIANEQWLTPVALSGSPGGLTASLVDNDGIYVAYGTVVMRYNLDGSNPVHLMNVPEGVHGMHSDGNLLFLNRSSGLYARLISIDKSTNTLIDTMENYVDSVYGSSISTTANRIFGRSQGISPADITFASYDDAGHFLGGGDSPYHGAYAGASTTWVFPLGTKVVDDSGGVYATSDLTRLGSFGTTITDITFVGSDVPIVLRSSTLTAYSAALLPTGSATLSQSFTQVLTNGTDVIAFKPNATAPNRYITQTVALSALGAPQPGTPINPVGLAYVPDHIEVAADGELLILDKETQSVFRWDADTQQYGATIPLLNIPRYMSYSPVTNTVYLAYASGLIDQISLDDQTLLERPFATLPSAPGGLATAGQYVFAEDASGAWVSHYTFAPDGTQISAVDWNYYSTEYIWSQANGQMYFFRDDTSPNDLLSEVIDSDGKIGARKDSPLHTSTGFQHPLRVAPDGSIVVLGSGMVHDATTLERLPGGLANSVADIAWLQGDVYSVRDISGYAQFQQWTGASFALGAVVQVQGKANALLALDDSRLVGIYTPASGVPQFRLFGAGLEVPAISGVALSQSSIAENLPDGSTVGKLSVAGPDLPTSITYTLVAGAGDADNACFTIAGDQLQTAASFNREVRNSYSIRVRAVNGSGKAWEQTFIIAVTDTNEPPSVITLTTSSVVENALAATLVGLLGTDDPDASETLSYSLVTGEGSADNASFAVIGNALYTAAAFDYEAKSTYSIRIRASDSAGHSIDDVFTVHVTNINEAPTITSFPAVVAEDGVLSIDLRAGGFTDVDGDAMAAIQVLTLPVYGLLQYDGTAVQAGQVIDASSLDVFTYTPTADYVGTDLIQWSATDGQAFSVVPAFVKVTVTAVNDAPVAGELSVAGDEDTAIAGSASATDVDLDDLSYSLVTSPSHGVVLFNADGSFSYTPNPDYFGPDEFTFGASDGSAESNLASVNITVHPVNDAPADITISASSIAENQPGNTLVGSLNAVDIDGPPPYTFALIYGEGDLDNSSFEIVEGELRTRATFDYESKHAYSIRVGVTDSDGLTFEKVIALQVDDVNEAPLDLSLSGSQIAEGAGANATVGTLTAADPDANSLDYSLVEGAGSADNGVFLISGSTLRAKGSFDFETRNSYSIRVRVTDADGLSLERSFTISVNDVEETELVLDGSDGNDTLAVTSSGTTVRLIRDGQVISERELAIISRVYINGLDGNDSISGASNLPVPLVIYGGDGDDTIAAGSMNDTIYGNAGDDVIYGGSGDDSILAGSGADRIFGQAGNDRIWSGDQSDTVRGGTGDDYIEGKGKADLLYGDDGNDSVRGMAGDDTIYGNFGDDSLQGLGGNDSIMGGVGADWIDGGTEDDRIWGGDQSDTIYGGDGDDYIEGKGKADTLYGGAGNDTLIGGAGADFTLGEDGDDILDASPSPLFHDTLIGGHGYDLYSADPDDTLQQLEADLLV